MSDLFNHRIKYFIDNKNIQVCMHECMRLCVYEIVCV